MAVYEHKTRIRYSEVDLNSFLTTTALIDLFQNCSTFQSEDLGLGCEYLAALQKAWVLSSWQIEITKRPKLGDYVTIKTWSTGVRMSLGHRNFALYDADNNLLACANSLWVYIDTQTGKPAKVPVEAIEAYGHDEPLEMKPYSRKIDMPENMTASNSFNVPFFYLDTNNHMNNNKYITAAMEYLPEDFNVTTVRTEYKKQALFHDLVIPKVGIDDKTVTVAMYDTDNNPYAYVQFISEDN